MESTSNNKIQILFYLKVVSDDLNYVSEWLQSLDLQDYLGNFFRCGLKTMIIVRSTDITQRKLNVSS